MPTEKRSSTAERRDFIVPVNTSISNTLARTIKQQVTIPEYLQALDNLLLSSRHRRHIRQKQQYCPSRLQ